MNLDPHQAAAATTTAKRVAVSAAPGSGKSRTVVARFEHMRTVLHIPAAHIILCTFTRYGAKVMSDRIGNSLRGAFCGTFHAFALMLIKMYGQSRGFEGHWLSLLDPCETDEEEKAILKDFGFINSRGAWSRGCTDTLWSRFKDRILGGVIDLAGELEGLDKDLALVWKTLMDRLRAENALTFDALILEALELFKDADTAARIRSRFQHVIGDEMQDASGLEWKMIAALQPETTFLVADPDQAIYEWRLAQPRLFIGYATSPDTTHYELNQSYRFGVNIAAPANALIKHNVSRLDKAINAIASNEGSVRVIKDAQYSDIASTIREELQSGTAPQDIVVLARRHATLVELASVLEGERIPFTRIQGGKDALPKTGAFRTVKGYLRLAVNPNDRRAFMAIATAERISTLDLMELRSRANSEHLSLAEAYGKDLPKDLGAIQARLHDQDPTTDYGPSLEWIRGIVLFEAISDPAELVEYLTMEDMQDQTRNVQDTVTLGTVHFSKGGEWKVVFVVGLNLAQFPSPRARKEGRIEEERRLLFVAISRAMETCYLVQHVPETFEDGPSQFLSEIGDVTQREIDPFKGDNLVY